MHRFVFIASIANFIFSIIKVFTVGPDAAAGYLALACVLALMAKDLIKDYESLRKPNPRPRP